MYGIKEFAFVPPPYGGVSTYIKRLIERLNELGIVSGGYYLPQCQDFSVRECELFDEWMWMPTHLFFPRIFKYIREVKPYEIVHSHFSLEGMLYLCTIKAVLRKKVIITVHNSMVEDYTKTTNVVNRFFLKRMAKSPNVTWIAVSEQTKSSMLRLPLHFGSEIKVIPAYIPLKPSGIGALSVGLQQYIEKHEKIIVFYGHSFMTYEGKDVYGFEMAIRMYGSLTTKERDRCGLVYCVADDSDKESIQKLQNIACSLDIGNDIYWQIGPIEKMASLWGCSDVYIRPTCTDGDSVAVREALDMGVQVVTSDVCIRPEKAIKYPYGNNDMFVETVRTALSNGKQQPNTNETYFIQMLEVYKELLAS